MYEVLRLVTSYRSNNSHYKNRFFESPPTAGIQKTDFGVSSTEGAGYTKIGFIMRIAIIEASMLRLRDLNMIW